MTFTKKNCALVRINIVQMNHADNWFSSSLTGLQSNMIGKPARSSIRSFHHFFSFFFFFYKGPYSGHTPPQVPPKGTPTAASKLAFPNSNNYCLHFILDTNTFAGTATPADLLQQTSQVFKKMRRIGWTEKHKFSTI